MEKTFKYIKVLKKNKKTARNRFCVKCDFLKWKFASIDEAIFPLMSILSRKNIQAIIVVKYGICLIATAPYVETITVESWDFFFLKQFNFFLPISGAVLTKSRV